MDRNERPDASGLNIYVGDTGSDASPVRDVETGPTVVRSAEELTVGTVNEVVGRVRLHKYIVTEDVTTTVTVRRSNSQYLWIVDLGDFAVSS